RNLPPAWSRRPLRGPSSRPRGCPPAADVPAALGSRGPPRAPLLRVLYVAWRPPVRPQDGTDRRLGYCARHAAGRGNPPDPDRAPPPTRGDWHSPLLPLPVVQETAPASLPSELDRGPSRRLSRPPVPCLRRAPIRVSGPLREELHPRALCALPQGAPRRRSSSTGPLGSGGYI